MRPLSLPGWRSNSAGRSASRALLVVALVTLAAASAAAQSPDWQPPPPGAYPETMTITGVVQVSGQELRSRDDRVAAFVDGEVRGVTGSTLVGNRRVFFLSVAGDLGDGALTFRAYDALADRVEEVRPSLEFDPQVPVGTVTAPVVWTPFVGGGPPGWDVDPADFPASMTITGQVLSFEDIVGESGALVAAFLDGELRGVAPIQTASPSVVFLTIYGTAGETGDLAFRVYRPSSDRTFAVSTSVPFSVGTTSGTFESPVLLSLRPGATLDGPEGWLTLAPPGADATVATVLSSIWTQGFPGAGASHGAPNVLRYVETQGGYVPVGSAGEAWPRGEGRLVYVYADDDPRRPPAGGDFPKTLPPVGIGPVDGFTFPLTRTPGNGDPVGAGWNLLGNPFDDPIDWDLGWTRTNIAGSVFVWDPAYMGGGYRVWNGTAGSLDGGIIPRGSGFWARLTAPDGVLHVPASARVGSSLLLGGDDPTVQAIGFRLESDERPGLGTEAWVTFQNGASDDEDPFDAWTLAPLVADYVAFGAVSPETGRLTSVEARSPNVRSRLSVPLAVGAVADGVPVEEPLVLTWPGVDVPDDWRLVLVDTETGEEVDLRETDAYRFTVAATASAASRRTMPPSPFGTGPGVVEAGGPARFRLVVSSATTTTTSPAPPQDVVLAPPIPNPSRGPITLTFELAEPGAVWIGLYDVLGRRVVDLATAEYAAGRHSLVVDRGTLPSGTYTVRLRQGETALSRRVTLME